MAAGYPSGTNVFVPSHEASGSLIIGYSRNPKKFKINKYMKMVPVKKDVGYYLVITAEEAARVINAGLNDFVWSDGQEAPMGNDNLESFQFTKFATVRYAFPFNLGHKAIEQADWKILSVHAGFAAQKAMTARTINFWQTLNTAGNWAGNTNTATSLGGGQWDAATTTNLYIKKALNQVCENILQATIGVVQREDLVLVINPHTARLMAESDEIHQYIKNTPFVFKELVGGTDQNPDDLWGLPPSLYGLKVVVEDAVKVTSKKGAATKTTGYCCPAQTAVVMARPGSLMGMEGIPEFSTIQGFFYEEFTVEQMDDVNNRRTVGRVVEDYTPALVAPASGYLITSATSS